MITTAAMKTVLVVFAIIYCALGKRLVNASPLTELTDATFEHQTQASTGMTTGSWLVLFETPSCQSCQSTIRPILSSLWGPDGDGDNDEEGEESDMTTSLQDRGILSATVNCEASADTCKRFDISQHPTILYFHKKQMYKFPLSNTEEEFLDISKTSVKAFVLEDYVNHQQMPIPLPPSPMDEILKPIMEFYEMGMKPENQLLLGAIGFMGLMLLVTIGVLLATLLSKKDSTSSKASDKAGTKKKVKKTKAS